MALLGLSNQSDSFPIWGKTPHFERAKRAKGVSHSGVLNPDHLSPTLHHIPPDTFWVRTWGCT